MGRQRQMTKNEERRDQKGHLPKKGPSCYPDPFVCNRLLVHLDTHTSESLQEDSPTR